MAFPTITISSAFVNFVSAVLSEILFTKTPYGVTKQHFKCLPLQKIQ